jgi:predicted Zn-dependent protease with MMP-like domain
MAAWIDSGEFETLVGEALDSLPERFASLVDNVVVTVEEEPGPTDRALLAHHHDELLGVFRGLPLTARRHDMLPLLPNQIAIFRGPILRVTHTRAHAVDQIRKTVIHELGHYFGLADHEMVF